MISKSLIIVAIALFFLPDIQAQERTENEEEAKQIFERVDERRSQIDSETAQLEMIIYDPRGRTRTRVIRSFTANHNGNTRSLLLFESPGSVRGTGFLSIREGGSDVQRLYLPDVGRIQTISASERGGRFMGSDFTYEDLGDQDPDDYQFLWMEEDETRYRVHARKADSDLYEALTFHIRKETYAVAKIEFYNEEDTLIRRLEAENFENPYGDYWSPKKMTMFDLQEDRKTEIIWNERNINESIPDWRFTERGLRRGLN